MEKEKIDLIKRTKLKKVIAGIILASLAAIPFVNAKNYLFKDDGADVLRVDKGGVTIPGVDNSTADKAYVPMVLYNTDATPPAASGFPIGTIYVQYTA